MPNSQTNIPSSNGKNRPAKGTVFAVKIILGFMILAGLIWGGKIILGSQTTTSSVWGPNNSDTPIEAASTTSEPSSLSIPSLNIKAKFERLGLNPDNTLQVPQNPNRVGWFVNRAKAGDIGPFVVVGHLDSVNGPAIFANLYKIKPGDIVEITRADNSIVKYKIDSSSKFPQNNFPAGQVYGPISFAGLRLITCSGTYIKDAKHYSDNLVVFGTLVN
jgi:sortase (surface protein transpeptidase)